MALDQVPTECEITLKLSSQKIFNSLSKQKSSLEDGGYDLVKRGTASLRIVINQLRQRKTHCRLHLLEQGDDDTDWQEAKAMVNQRDEDGTSGGTNGVMCPSQFNVAGVKLSSLTQASAYKAIRHIKKAKVKPRQATRSNLDEIADRIQESGNMRPVDSEIWRGIYSPHISKECRSFIWMAIHNGYMVGSHWLRGSMSAELQERAICDHPDCLMIDSMDHILFRCEAIGQKVVWDSLKEIWNDANLTPREINWGSVFASPLLQHEGGTKISTDEKNLWTILSSEAVHLIWKLRCERVIRNEKAEFSKEEVAARWKACISARLNLDRRTAALTSLQLFPK
ncbi:uncharacterized protein BXZ73DRAFT_44606 [Epithele typhae]|uniref:uncharacterized protein n=1 Tax=Epithele typhae TaxID=378194 RepID=UPI002008B053|nr:uncharacterized protein BXZ73DRAFT_44606 [Epithele typhae]KAH9937787.1 hypothetical protein BXZ73DRAFT_44606 [Epithele typhae]